MWSRRGGPRDEIAGKKGRNIGGKRCRFSTTLLLVAVTLLLLVPPSRCGFKEVVDTANDLLGQQRYGECVTHLESRVAKHKNPQELGHLHTLLGRAHAFAGNHAQSARAYESTIATKGFKDNNMVWEAMVNNGRTYWRSLAHNVQAVASLESAFKIRPDKLDPVFELCLLYTSSLDTANLRKWAKVILKRDSDNLSGLAYLYESYHMEARLKEAAVVTAKIIKVEPRLCTSVAAYILALNSQFEWQKASLHVDALVDTIMTNKCKSANSDGTVRANQGWFPGRGLPRESLFIPKFGPEIIRKIADADTKMDLIEAATDSRGVTPPVFSYASLAAKGSGGNASGGIMRLGFYSSTAFSSVGPMTSLIQDVFALHNPHWVATACFTQLMCSGVPTSAARAKILQTCGSYHCVEGTNPVTLATAINNRGIHVLLELTGHTSGKKFGALTYRPAPVQMHFLEFPSTIGGTFVDYFVSTPEILPPEFSEYMAEHIIRLPASHFMNSFKSHPSYKQALAETKSTASGVTICSYNNPIKLSSDDFESWVRILVRVPSATLHLKAPIKKIVGDLLPMLAEAGVAHERVHLVKGVGLEVYLGNLGACDLFLDSSVYNAGATALDALWMGTPVLTMPGRIVSARVSAGLSVHHCSRETVVHSRMEYEDLAVSILESPERRTRLRQKIRSCLLKSPLFDSQAIVGELETSLVAATEIRLSKYPASLHLSFP